MFIKVLLTILLTLSGAQAKEFLSFYCTTQKKEAQEIRYEVFFDEEYIRFVQIIESGPMVTLENAQLYFSDTFEGVGSTIIRFNDHDDNPWELTYNDDSDYTHSFVKRTDLSKKKTRKVYLDCVTP